MVAYKSPFHSSHLSKGIRYAVLLHFFGGVDTKGLRNEMIMKINKAYFTIIKKLEKMQRHDSKFRDFFLL